MGRSKGKRHLTAGNARRGADRLVVPPGTQPRNRWERRRQQKRAGKRRGG